MFFKKKPLPLPDDVTALLKLAKQEMDPVKRYQCLEKAKGIAPDSLAVCRALLMHGKAHLRPKDIIDFSFIPCYVLHAFEHPEKFDEKTQEKYARALFDDPNLAVCLALVTEKDEFMKTYLFDMCKEYLHIFIQNETSHIPKIMGFATTNNVAKHLAPPSGDVIMNIFLSPYITEQEQRLLAGHFYRAYGMMMGGETSQLDAYIGDEICSLLADC